MNHDGFGFKTANFTERRQVCSYECTFLKDLYYLELFCSCNRMCTISILKYRLMPHAVSVALRLEWATVQLGSERVKYLSLRSVTGGVFPQDGVDI